MEMSDLHDIEESARYWQRKCVKQQAEIERLKRLLCESGFVRCDIPACNCGSWHQTGGWAARFREIEEATHDYWQNGETLLDRIKRMAAEIERLRALAVAILTACCDALDQDTP